MEFSPANPVVKLCLQGIRAADAGNANAANQCFMDAWRDATDDFERFLAAWFVARQQLDATQQLHWLNAALQHALRVDDPAAISALPTLYASIAASCDALGDAAKAHANRRLAASFDGTPSDGGPFYHGTRASLQVGDLLVAGGTSNYKASLQMNHIYFTALVSGAGLAAGMARGDAVQRVYVVEPTGVFAHDPNVTDKKFPGNPTRSYRSEAPLRIVGEATDWVKQSPDDLRQWREKLANSAGEIVN
jgi:Rifampin ADP-ribosyl transferase